MPEKYLVVTRLILISLNFWIPYICNYRSAFIFLDVYSFMTYYISREILKMEVLC